MSYDRLLELSTLMLWRVVRILYDSSCGNLIFSCWICLGLFLDHSMMICGFWRNRTCFWEKSNCHLELSSTMVLFISKWIFLFVLFTIWNRTRTINSTWARRIPKVTNIFNQMKNGMFCSCHTMLNKIYIYCWGIEIARDRYGLGKSWVSRWTTRIVCLGFCRLLRREGWRVSQLIAIVFDFMSFIEVIWVFIRLVISSIMIFIVFMYSITF